MIAFVPVRIGSISMPKKNIKLFCGQPLIYWVLQALEASEIIIKVVVASDSDEIDDVVNRFSFDKVTIYRREIVNADSIASTEAVMLEYLQKESYGNDVPFVLVQATSPFLRPSDIDEAFMLLEKHASVVSCVRQRRFYWSASGEPINYDITKRPRRQDFDGVLMENGAFYISTIGQILNTQNRLAEDVGVYEMPEYSGLELDEPLDWEIGEAIGKKIGLKKTIGQVKLVGLDVDGVLTDGGMYYSPDGEMMKRFNTRDGKGIELLRKAGIEVAIITSETSGFSVARAKKLGIERVYTGIKDKLSVMKIIVAELGVSLEEVAHIGDDINDKALLEAVGVAFCPSDAHVHVKAVPGIQVLSRCGGQGAVREMVDMLV